MFGGEKLVIRKERGCVWVTQRQTTVLWTVKPTPAPQGNNDSACSALCGRTLPHIVTALLLLLLRPVIITVVKRFTYDSHKANTLRQITFEKKCICFFNTKIIKILSLYNLDYFDNSQDADGLWWINMNFYLHESTQRNRVYSRLLCVPLISGQVYMTVENSKLQQKKEHQHFEEGTVQL